MPGPPKINGLLRLPTPSWCVPRDNPSRPSSGLRPPTNTDTPRLGACRGTTHPVPHLVYAPPPTQTHPLLVGAVGQPIPSLIWFTPPHQHRHTPSWCVPWDNPSRPSSGLRPPHQHRHTPSWWVPWDNPSRPSSGLRPPTNTDTPPLGACRGTTHPVPHLVYAPPTNTDTSPLGSARTRMPCVLCPGVPHRHCRCGTAAAAGAHGRGRAPPERAWLCHGTADGGGGTPRRQLQQRDLGHGARGLHAQLRGGHTGHLPRGSVPAHECQHDGAYRGAPLGHGIAGVCAVTGRSLVDKFSPPSPPSFSL